MYSNWRGGAVKKQPKRNDYQRHFNCGVDKSSGGTLVLCVDLEFNITTDRKLNNKEIVEIGVVLIDKFGKVVDSFSSFCNPNFGWVTEDTLEFISVSRSSIDTAPDLKAVLKSVDEHFSKYLDDVDYWCSWGDADLTVIKNSMSRYSVTSSIFSKIKYVNAQDRYDYRMNSYRRTSLVDAVYSQGLVFTGDAHRALNDAHALGSLIRSWVL